MSRPSCCVRSSEGLCFPVRSDCFVRRGDVNVNVPSEMGIGYMGGGGKMKRHGYHDATAVDFEYVRVSVGVTSAFSVELFSLKEAYAVSRDQE